MVVAGCYCSFGWVFFAEASCSRNNQEEEDYKSSRYMKQDISHPDNKNILPSDKHRKVTNASKLSLKKEELATFGMNLYIEFGSS